MSAICFPIPGPQYATNTAHVNDVEVLLNCVQRLEYPVHTGCEGLKASLNLFGFVFIGGENDVFGVNALVGFGGYRKPWIEKGVVKAAGDLTDGLEREPRFSCAAVAGKHCGGVGREPIGYEPLPRGVRNITPRCDGDGFVVL